MDTVVTDVLRLILRHLDSPSQFVARFVCKRWYSLLPCERSVRLSDYVPNVALLQWAHGFNMPHGYMYSYKIGDYGSHSIEAYRWSVSHNIPVNTEDVIDEASWAGHLELLQWLYKEDPGIIEHLARYHGAKYHAFARRHPHILQWLASLDITMTVAETSTAIRCGHLEYLRWLVDNGAPVDNVLVDCLIRDRRYDILECIKDKYKFEFYHYEIANGDLQMLQWLKSCGCPSNKYDSGPT